MDPTTALYHGAAAKTAVAQSPSSSPIQSTVTKRRLAARVFSFSLTLGDYIAVEIVGGAIQTLGTLVYTNVGTANNLPLAAAIAFIPIAIIFIYLAAVSRTGALRNL